MQKKANTMFIPVLELLKAIVQCACNLTIQNTNGNIHTVDMFYNVYTLGLLVDTFTNTATVP